MRLRRHQHELAQLCAALAQGDGQLRDVLAAVTPGGGKSALPVIAAAYLLRAGIAERVCWVVPRDSLKRQAEESFLAPRWRQALDHRLSVRAADNAPDPCRDTQGYVTTYQAIAAAPALHEAAFRRHRYLLCVDELHHVPSLSEGAALNEEDAAWSRALQPLLRLSAVRLLMTGTLQRADQRQILHLPYRRQRLTPHTSTVDRRAPGWAFIGYDRRAALTEQAIIPIRFGALDGEAEWQYGGECFAIRSLRGVHDRLGQALYTSLRTQYAEQLLRKAFLSCRQHRARRRQTLGLAAEARAPGLGKLLIVAPSQAEARRYAATLRRWLNPADDGGANDPVALAISEERESLARIQRYRQRPDPAVLCTVGMAYEGLDCPDISHIACLTHIRSVPWLEQMTARATRFDPQGGDFAEQKAHVFHPDDPLFQRFRTSIEAEQGMSARGKRKRDDQPELPFDEVEEDDPLANLMRASILPIRSQATQLRFTTVALDDRPEAAAPAARINGEAAHNASLRPAEGETPSEHEARLRKLVQRLVADQVAEDEARERGAPWRFHTYNAVLKRITGKPRAAMSAEELRVAITWLRSNRISAHLSLLEGDRKYHWLRQRERARARLRATGEPH